MAIDPQLVGEWVDFKGVRLVFREDASFWSGAVNVPIVLEGGGSRLIVNQKTTYLRQTGDPAGIVGHWRNEVDGEEVTYRPDGRSVGIWDMENAAYFGVYTATATALTEYACLGFAATADGSVHFCPILRLPESLPYTATPTALTFHRLGWQEVYPRVTPGNFPPDVPPIRVRGAGPPLFSGRRRSWWRASEALWSEEGLDGRASRPQRTRHPPGTRRLQCLRDRSPGRSAGAERRPDAAGGAGGDRAGEAGARAGAASVE